MTIHMDLFATSISRNRLRFGLFRLSSEAEQFGLLFWDDLNWRLSPIIDTPISIAPELARAALNGKERPESPDEQVEVIIRVLHDPKVRLDLEIDVEGSSTHPMIKDYYRSVDAMKEAEALNDVSLSARQKDEGKDSSEGGRRTRSGGL